MMDGVSIQKAIPRDQGSSRASVIAMLGGGKRFGGGRGGAKFDSGITALVWPATRSHEAKEVEKH